MNKCYTNTRALEEHKTNRSELSKSSNLAISSLTKMVKEITQEGLLCPRLVLTSGYRCMTAEEISSKITPLPVIIAFH
jgi:hypothetical protein